VKPERYQERRVEIDGWQLNVTSYETDGTFHCSVDNVSPGAWLARTTGATREEAEQRAIARARELLARTRRRNIEADSG
jgi:hypothetical protein